MKVLLDNIIYSKEKQGGISNYWYELSKYFLTVDDMELYFCEGPNAENNLFRKQLHLENIIKSKLSFITKPLIQRLLPISYTSEEFILYHSSFYRPLQGTKEYVEATTIHDFTHNYYFPPHKRILHNKLKYAAIKRSQGIICVSHNTYNDLVKFCPPAASQKKIVIYNGVSEDYCKLSDEIAFAELKNRFDFNPGYLLYVGGRTSYKNFNFVAALLNDLKNTRLVIVGSNLSDTEKKLFNKDVQSQIVVLNRVNNIELNILYNNAHALIYPSSYEGFGLPVVEAMKAGCPVLALNNSSIAEVSGNATILLDKTDVSLFKNAFHQLNNHDYKENLKNLGYEQAEKFSWSKSSAQTYEFYKELHR